MADDSDWLQVGVLYVASTRRLAHFLRARHDAVCQVRGLRVWQTPEVVTWPELLRRQFDLDRASGRTAARWLDASHGLVVWEQIVRRDVDLRPVLLPSGLGAVAQRSWDLLHAYRIPVRALAEDASPEVHSFARWAAEFGRWLAQGGWWPLQPILLPPVSLVSPERWLGHARAPWALDPSCDEFYLHFTWPAYGQANIPARPGEPCWVGMHPVAVRRLGLRSGDLVRLATASAEIEARIVEQADLHFDTLVVPLEQSRSNYSKPLDLVNGEQNESGDLAFQTGRVRVYPAS